MVLSAKNIAYLLELLAEKHGRGYSEDKEISKLQVRLSIMLEMAQDREAAVRKAEEPPASNARPGGDELAHVKRLVQCSACSGEWVVSAAKLRELDRVCCPYCKSVVKDASGTPEAELV